MKLIQLKETELNTLIKTIIHESTLLKETKRCRKLGRSCDGGDGTWCEKPEHRGGGCYCSKIGYCKANALVVPDDPMGGGPGDNNYQIVGGGCPGCGECSPNDCLTCTNGGEKCLSATDKVVAMPKSRALGEQTIQLRESDLIKLIHRVINEQQ